MARKPSSKPEAGASSTATISIGAKLWLAADQLRNKRDATDYKHVVLGLIFLKHISDTFRKVQHPDFRAGLLIAKLPFNDADWLCKDDDSALRDSQIGIPPIGKADFERVQHFIHGLALGGDGTAGGKAGFVPSQLRRRFTQAGEWIIAPKPRCVQFVQAENA